MHLHGNPGSIDHISPPPNYSTNSKYTDWKFIVWKCGKVQIFAALPRFITQYAPPYIDEEEHVIYFLYVL